MITDTTLKPNPQLPFPTPTSLPLVASSIHCHPLGIPAGFPVSRGTDWSAATGTSRTALLERQQLFGTEGLVVDLRGGFNQVLEVSAGEEVSEVDEFTVILVLNYHTISFQRPAEAE